MISPASKTHFIDTILFPWNHMTDLLSVFIGASDAVSYTAPRWQLFFIVWDSIELPVASLHFYCDQGMNLDLGSLKS